MGQVCREVYLSREVVVQEKGAVERDAGGGRDGPWATQGMSMGYAYKEIVVWVKGRFGVCVCVCHTL